MQITSTPASNILALPLPAKPQSAESGRGVVPRPAQVTEAGEAAALVKDPRGLQALMESGTRRDAAGLTEAEQALVKQLAARDREVRDHEQAHARVGGPYAGEPTYTYQTGPDGQRYAVGGAVSIDTAPVRDDPRATIRKMEVVKAAALAPAEPSAADRQIAAIAEAQKLRAIGDLNAAQTAAAGPEGATAAGGAKTRVEAFLEALASLTDVVQGRNTGASLDLVA